MLASNSHPAAGRGTAGVCVIPVAVKPEASGLPTIAEKMPIKRCPSLKSAKAVAPINKLPGTVTGLPDSPSTSMSNENVSPTPKSLKLRTNEVAPSATTGNPMRPVVAALPPTGVNGTPSVLLFGGPPFTVSKTSPVPDRSIPNLKRFSPSSDKFVKLNGWVNVSPSMMKLRMGVAAAALASATEKPAAETRVLTHIITPLPECLGYLNCRMKRTSTCAPLSSLLASLFRGAAV